MPPNNLPHPLTSFVGRRHELAAVSDLLAKTRLLTLTGTGGTGKTRLALELAHAALDDYPGGVWWVELATLVEPDLVPQAIAATLGVHEEPGRDLTATLADSLHPSPTLLVLDNCEHLATACASLAGTLLRAAPNLRILTTSRQALCIEGELAWQVPPLSVPDPHRSYPVEELARFGAVQLFVERALFRRPDFALIPENAAAVAALCARLEGLPLLIELAAARVRLLSVEQILQRLDERLQLLQSPSASTPPRHKSLQALMDWSYELLPESERALLRRLSVFSGNFTLEAAESICTPDSGEYPVIDVLGQLVDKSLVMVDDHSSDSCYRLLETIRQYAWGKLVDAGEMELFRSRHLAWYLQSAEGTEDELLSERQAVWLLWLEREHDNLRAALAWSQSDTSIEDAGLRLAGALVWFWYFRGYLREGRIWMERALANRHRSIETAAGAKVLSAAGALAFLQGDIDIARGYLERGLAIWRALDDRRGTAFALSFLGRVAARQGSRGGEGRRYGEESVRLFRAIGEKWGLALSLDFLGEIARDEGRDEQAAELHRESLDLYRELGHKWGIGLELSNFGLVSMRKGDYEAARKRLEEALSIHREIGDKWLVAWTLRNLGDVEAHLGNGARAGTLYAESLAIFEDLGDREGIILLRGSLAGDPSVAGVVNVESARARPEQPEGLTARELEVLRLVAGGLTAAQVADQLSVSTRTVQAHIRSIYRKTGVTTRSAATLYAVERGLVGS